MSRPYSRIKTFVCFTLLLTGVMVKPLSAFEKLTDAQALIYDTPHLSNTVSGQTITYEYSGNTGEQPVSDQVNLTITGVADKERRDVSIEFLTEQRQLTLPDFNGYRGNPVIIAMLEYIARTMGNDTGGGALYFRNRIRDALAVENLNIADVKINIGDQEITAKEIQFSPFENDTMLSNNPEYKASLFNITFSDTVPGGVVSVSVKSVVDDETQFFHGITLRTL